jgi:26S proteasome regulatory subunit N7
LDEAQTVAIGQKMDLMFSLLRLDFIHGDYMAVKANLGKARKLFQEGGDWERKNRLKVKQSKQHSSMSSLSSLSSIKPHT